MKGIPYRPRGAEKAVVVASRQSVRSDPIGEPDLAGPDCVEAGPSSSGLAEPDLVGIARDVHRALVSSGKPAGAFDPAALRSRVEAVAPLLSNQDLDSAAVLVSQLLFGLGPLDTLLGDQHVTEVMVNGAGTVWVERHGQLMRSDVTLDDDLVRVAIDRILGPLGLRVDRTAPFVDARLPDGSRVNIAVPPLAIDGPYLTIRRFRAAALQLQDFCNAEVGQLLRKQMRRRACLVVSGGTGSGKTSLLNALGAHIAPTERVVTIEDAAELQLPGDHIVRLEARPANAEGVGEVTMRALLRNALRMRPDRLVIGEVRGPEALDLVQAMNTGHEGCLSTCHANSPTDALRRLESMVLMSDNPMPIQVVREHLRAALDLVVHVSRANDGARRVESVLACSPDGNDRWLVRNGQLQ